MKEFLNTVFCCALLYFHVFLVFYCVLSYVTVFYRILMFFIVDNVFFFYGEYICIKMCNLF